MSYRIDGARRGQRSEARSDERVEVKEMRRSKAELSELVTTCVDFSLLIAGIWCDPIGLAMLLHLESIASSQVVIVVQFIDEYCYKCETSSQRNTADQYNGSSRTAAGKRCCGHDLHQSPGSATGLFSAETSLK